MVVELARDVIRTQDQLGPLDSTNLVFKLFNEKIPKVYGTTRQKKRSLGHAFTVGHPTNGIVGAANGVDGSQILVGAAYLGSSIEQTVVSLENTFVEALRDTTFVDTTNTTATVNTTTKAITF